MNKTKCNLIILVVFSMFLLLGASKVQAIKPEDLGLKEGDLISAIFSDDPDVYIINEHGYKRLFLNPEIFKFYGHLGGFANVKLVTPEIRDAFITSGYFRDCENNDQKVYGVQVSGEDSGELRWVNTSAGQAIKEDPAFFNKVFCINNKEFNWYPKGNPFYSVIEVPKYVRQHEPKITPNPTVVPSTSSPIPTISPTPLPRVSTSIVNPPKIYGPTSIIAGTSNLYSAVASTLDLASISYITYTFDWGDGSPKQSKTIESGYSAYHIWNNSGIYTITATATNYVNGKSATSILAVKVSGLNPPIISGPTSVIAGSSNLYFAVADVAGFSKGQDEAAYYITYTFDWGDSSPRESKAIESGYSVYHIWHSPGIYTITVAATDSKGNSSSGILLVKVSQPVNNAPSIPVISGPTSANVGDNLLYSAISTDQDNDSITYTFDWGDSSPRESKAIESGYSVYHIWNNSGIYIITVTADDLKGGVSSTTLAVKVSQ